MNPTVTQMFHNVLTAVKVTENVGTSILRAKRTDYRNVSQVAPSSKSRTEGALYKWMERKPKSYNKNSSSRVFTKTRLPSKGILRPAAISQKIHAFCDNDRLQDAVDLVKLSPIYSQNTIVWNTLLTKVLNAQKYELAYQLFIDMKRRGHKPSTATFITLFSNYSQIEDWKTHTKQLNHCHSLYTQFLKHVEQLKLMETKKNDITVGPAVLYMKILSKAGLYQKMFDVFNELDEDGPMAPNERVFSMLFHALAHRKVSEKLDGLPIAIQNASDGKMVWRQMEKLIETNNFTIDEEILASGIRLISKGRSSDQQFAFEIVRKHLGLIPAAEGPSHPRSIITSSIVQSTLELCNLSKNHTLCTQYGIELLKKGLDVDRRNMEEVLSAHYALAESGETTESEKALDVIKRMLQKGTPKLLPDAGTYALVFMICNREKSWNCAVTALELMTGYLSKDFLPITAQGDRGAKVQNKKLINSNSRTVSLDAKGMLYLARIASNQEDNSIMQQCLRIIQFFGGRSIFDGASHNDTEHHKSYLASEILRLISKIPSGSASKSDWRNWHNMKQAVEAYRYRHPRKSTDMTPTASSDKKTGQIMMPEAVEFQHMT